MAAIKKTKQKEIEIAAADGDRNLDIFFNEDKSRGRTEYFYTARRKYTIGQRCVKKPEYILIEIRKYVLGVMYLWQLKN